MSRLTEQSTLCYVNVKYGTHLNYSAILRLRGVCKIYFFGVSNFDFFCCDIWYSKDEINIFLIRCELVPSLSSLVVCNMWTSKPLCVLLLDEIRIIDSRIIVLILRLMI